MSFTAANGSKSKTIRPGVEFPVKTSKGIEAVLFVAENNPDQVRVTVAGSSNIIVCSYDDKDQLSGEGSIVIVAKGFSICDLDNGHSIEVSYEEDIQLE